ncbi:MAG: hypothetical protein ABFD24_06125 [Anaerolineaceae bacterium]
MAISYDDSRTAPSKPAVQPNKPRGVVYGGAQDSDLITQQQRRNPRYVPQNTDWFNSYLYQMQQSRQNVAEEDAAYLPGGRSRNNQRFIESPNFGGGDTGLGIGGVNIPSFGVGPNPNQVKFTNPTPVVTPPTAPKLPTFLDLVKKAFVDAANSPTVSGIGGFGGVTMPGTAEIPDLTKLLDTNPSVLDQYYAEHLGANGEVAEARNQKRLDPYDTEYGWRLRDIYNENRVKQLTQPPNRGGGNNSYQNQGQWPYGFPYYGWGGGGGGGTYSDALQNYYNALMNWRIPVG